MCVGTTHAGFGVILHSNKNKVVFFANASVLYQVCYHLSPFLCSSLHCPSADIDVADAEDNIRGNINTSLKKTNIYVESLSTPDATTTVL